MATTQTTRRSVLGAMAALPAVIAMPAIAQTPNTAEWDRAYRAWLPIAAHHDALADEWERLEAAETVDNVAEGAAYDAMRAHMPAYWDARNAFMEVPAPHVRALLIKMEISTVSLDDEHAEAVLADARRLLGDA